MHQIIGKNMIFRLSQNPELILISVLSAPTKPSIQGLAPMNVDYKYEINRKCQDYVYIKWEYWSTM